MSNSTRNKNQHREQRVENSERRGRKERFRAEFRVFQGFRAEGRRRAARAGWAGRIDWPIKGVVFGDFELVFTNKRGFEEQKLGGGKQFQVIGQTAGWLGGSWSGSDTPLPSLTRPADTSGQSHVPRLNRRRTSPSGR